MEPTNRDWEDLKARYLRWVLVTFPDETPAQQALHLSKELVEFASARTRADAVKEMADVMMMLWCVSNRVVWMKLNHGISSEELKEAIEAKLKINMERKWEKTAEGDYQHVD